MPPNSQAEIFVWNVLVQLGQQSRWGTEVDLLTPIGRAATNPPRSAPVGRVTLRIDNAGNAAATLVGGGPSVPGPVFPTREAAVTALQALGFANVIDGRAPWTVPELSKAHSALSRVPAADLSALNGVDLVREHALTLNGRRWRASSSIPPGAVALSDRPT